MNMSKKIAAFSAAVLISIQASIPAYADMQIPPMTNTVAYSQVEQLVLNQNLQVDSNQLMIGSMDNETELKEKYKEITDSLAQTSSSLSSILNNPTASPDLKAVAQGTNVALVSLTEMLNSQEDASNDDFELTELQANLSNNQLVKTAQSLFSVYYQLQYNIKQLNNTRVLLEEKQKAAQSQYELKMGTALEVDDANSAISTLDNNIAELQNQSESASYQMNQLLGYSYNDTIIFGAMPEPDIGYINQINLNSDIVAAQSASYKVQISLKERSILSDDTLENREKRQMKSNEAELERQNVGASLQSQYNAIKKQQAVLATEQQKLGSAKQKADQAQLKYDLGLLSNMELNQVKNDYYSERTAVNTAESTLFWQIESYKWIVKGLSAS